MEEILEITSYVAATFERLDIPYLIGGSLASSLHGIPRATQDVDIVARIAGTDVAGLISALGGAFYFDEPAIREAIRQRASFNLIHLGTLLKVDVFVAKDDEGSVAQMERRQAYDVEGLPRPLVLASAEDVVAHKLYWYRLGDGVSERQWSDALGVLRVAGERLDREYLRLAARRLGVEDLLARILQQSADPDLR